MKKAWIMHPFFFAVFPLLFLFEHNLAETPASQVRLPLVISLGASAALLLLARLILKDSHKAGMLVSLLLVVFFNYGRIDTLLRNARLFPISDNLPWISLALLIAVAVPAIRTKKGLAPLTNFLNIAVGAMVLMSLFGIVTNTLNKQSVWELLGQDESPEAAAGISAEKTRDLPDIYYIILDSYPREDTLSEIYSFDNAEFLDFLKDRGFYVAEESRANYAMTYFSLASSLNMEHLDLLTANLDSSPSNASIPARLIRDNKVMKVAKALGYKTVHVRSGWSGTDHNDNADIEIDYGSGDEFTMLLVRTTALKRVDARLGLFRARARDRVLSNFKQLGEVPKINGPTFTFAHIIPPHPPFFFGAKGEPVKNPRLIMQGRVWEQKQMYLDQLTFVNAKVETLVDKLLKDSSKPPIIIIQSDHGSASSFYTEKPGSWRNPSDRQVRERMRILNAYYAPKISKRKFRADITPVNTFRLIFNEYFKTGYDLLEDKSLYSYYQAPFDFTDMTKRIRGR